jgi:hypothetical protein
LKITFVGPVMCVIKASIYENLLTTFLDFKIVAWRFPSISATALVGLSKLALRHGLRHSAGGTSMPAAETNYVFQRPKRAVAIRRDGDEFVVSLMPNDLVIFRNESAEPLRKLCKGLRWAVVSDTAIASI